jgi:hypothetical protein
MDGRRAAGMDDVETRKPGRDVLAEGEGMTPEMYRLFCIFVSIEGIANLAATQPPETMRRLLGGIVEAARKGIEEVKSHPRWPDPPELGAAGG